MDLRSNALRILVLTTGRVPHCFNFAVDTSMKIVMSNLHFSICRYKHLLLVAGGIGISPFLAVLSDIVHRIKEGKPCMPKNVVIVWAIKRSDELPLLSMLNMESIDPVLLDALNLEIQIYVTRESGPTLVSHDSLVSLYIFIADCPHHLFSACCSFHNVLCFSLDIFVSSQTPVWLYPYVLLMQCYAM